MCTHVNQIIEYIIIIALDLKIFNEGAYLNQIIEYITIIALDLKIFNEGAYLTF